MSVVYYTDGSAHPNPGFGGFGVVTVENNKIINTYSKACKYTTNNAEEMKAILWAACDAIQRGIPAVIYSDSAYAINTFTNWMFSWERNGWLKSDGKVPENLELVKSFFNLQKTYSIQLIKVRGHAGNEFNEIADKLATSAKLPIDFNL